MRVAPTMGLAPGSASAAASPWRLISGGRRVEGLESGLASRTLLLEFHAAPYPSCSFWRFSHLLRARGGVRVTDGAGLAVGVGDRLGVGLGFGSGGRLERLPVRAHGVRLRRLGPSEGLPRRGHLDGGEGLPVEVLVEGMLLQLVSPFQPAQGRGRGSGSQAGWVVGHTLEVEFKLVVGCT